MQNDIEKSERSAGFAPLGGSVSELEIPCPNGCDPKTAPTPNPRFCLACNNTGWAKAGVMPEKTDEVEVRMIPARITTGNVFRDAMANNRGIHTNS